MQRSTPSSPADLPLPVPRARAGVQVLLSLALAALIFGCTRENPDYLDATWLPDKMPLKDRATPPTETAPPPPDQGVPVPDKPALSKPKGVDVLVVVDNSPGMAYAQLWLGRDLANLVADLESLPGGPDYRIGVITTDMGIGTYATANCSSSGDGAKLILSSQCPNTSTGVKYLEGKGNNVNMPIPASQAVACMTKLGEGGCGFERPLTAMRVAISSSAKSFFRKDAALAVIILSNEDDCSAKSNDFFDPDDPSLGPLTSFRCFQFGVTCKEGNPPRDQTVLTDCAPGQTKLHDVNSYFVQYFKTLKPASWLSVLVISGPPHQYADIGIRYVRGTKYWYVKPTCTNMYQSGDPGFRLRAFAKGLNPNGFVHDICVNDYKPAMKALFGGIKAAF